LPNLNCRRLVFDGHDGGAVFFNLPVELRQCGVGDDRIV
jgi:hypothetical protein